MKAFLTITLLTVTLSGHAGMAQTEVSGDGFRAVLSDHDGMARLQIYETVKGAEVLKLDNDGIAPLPQTVIEASEGALKLVTGGNHTETVAIRKIDSEWYVTGFSRQGEGVDCVAETTPDSPSQQSTVNGITARLQLETDTLMAAGWDPTSADRLALCGK